MHNVYFDEKMNGTVHVALGMGFDYVGGTNESAIHWDIVKDLRPGGSTSVALDGSGVLSDFGRFVCASCESQHLGDIKPGHGGMRHRSRLATRKHFPFAGLFEMGDPGFEPGTSALSERRSNQLS